MALDPGAYGTVAAVTARTQHFGEFKENDSKQPTIGDVEEALNESAHEIDMCLSECGFLTPVDKTDHPVAVSWLATINSLGAAYRVEASVAGAARGDDENLRFIVLKMRYEQKLDHIRETMGKALLVVGVPRVTGWGAADGFVVNGQGTVDATVPEALIGPTDNLDVYESERLYPDDIRETV